MSNEVREDAWRRRKPHESATGQLHREAGGATRRPRKGEMEPVSDC